MGRGEQKEVHTSDVREESLIEANVGVQMGDRSNVTISVVRH